jgi:hypothetical protein
VVTAPNVEVQVVHYLLIAPGIPAREGDIDVATPGATVSAVIGGVPASDDYQLVLSALSTGGTTTCGGSAAFRVIAGAETGVTVVLQCRAEGMAGGTEVIVTINNCPTIAFTAVSPLQVGIGGTISSFSQAMDLDSNALSYAWTATGGSFSDPTASDTTYTCTVAGSQMLTLTVSDGYCQTAATLPVMCLPFCGFHPDDTPCDDGNACTQMDRCQAGVCVGSDPVVCAPAPVCHGPAVCDPGTGVCSDPLEPDGTSCPLPNASASCLGGVCQLLSCASPFGSCDGMSGNGCETDLGTSTQHCGSCGNACAAGLECASGICLSPPPTE